MTFVLEGLVMVSRGVNGHSGAKLTLYRRVMNGSSELRVTRNIVISKRVTVRTRPTDGTAKLLV